MNYKPVTAKAVDEEEYAKEIADGKAVNEQ